MKVNDIFDLSVPTLKSFRTQFDNNDLDVFYNIFSFGFMAGYKQNSFEKSENKTPDNNSSTDVEYYKNKIIEIVEKYDNPYWLKIMFAYIRDLSKN